PSKDDGLPSSICKECSRQLKRSYSFNLKCEESDRKLRKFLENTNDQLSQNDLVKSNDSKDSLDVKTEVEEVKYEEVFDVRNEDQIVNGDNNNQPMMIMTMGMTVVGMQMMIIFSSMKYNSSKRVKMWLNQKRKGDERNPALPESKLPHQCDVCGKFLSTKSNLKAHKICHTDLRPYKCADCPATFSALFQHKKVHTRETPYHCEYCPKQFSRRTGLVNHIRMHTGFPIKADLKVHQRIHNGEKPYSCHLCSKTFATSGNLSIHVRIHNKEVRYHCKECQRGFVTCSAYNVHLKRHKGQRDYHCECGKTFYTSSALKQHKVVHTGEKKYQCKICERKFSQTSHLSRHFKRDHAKPNMPLPSSDHYKVVVTQEENKAVFGLFDVHSVNQGVKCERS
ncbi:hypothetical protein MSG28_011728, partial [Choristoneura fumiferana]